ncbi:hypothetical protein RhiirA5_433940 [Rhizophagus irregularis]|uniref:Uncharacterized protein n=1 Tax=Rhizophagus irregularis TaxID=588596 RepID=A0A2N0QSZ4_9GLOM|nr:hypothetical protein RhiirA5_433940 [Rhizophagus irregularis]PKC54140.1 hypothetical protein RhiirA1_477893 [Rhizophagus irregularis]GET52226.1 hypothetical protein RIR_jg30446.t1 [Rhizophagus irregularis DAOM 181602=DAOM 197198]
MFKAAQGAMILLATVSLCQTVAQIIPFRPATYMKIFEKYHKIEVKFYRYIEFFNISVYRISAYRGDVMFLINPNPRSLDCSEYNALDTCRHVLDINCIVTNSWVPAK